MPRLNGTFIRCPVEERDYVSNCPYLFEIEKKIQLRRN